MSDKNFKEETLTILTNHHLFPGDVLWVGNGSWFCDFDDFLEAADFNYDSGFGGEVIDTNLKVVGVDWWLERRTYDGAEWWEYNTYPYAEGHYLKKIEQENLLEQ